MRHHRTRNGCLTCRTRRKKCDEVKPRCAGCRRNQLPCTWPSPPPPTETTAINDYRLGALRCRRGGEVPTELAVSNRPAGPVVWQQQQQSVSAATRIATTIPPPVPMIYRGAESDGRDQRPCAMAPLSVYFLSHFLTHTASFFAMGPLHENPFVTLLVPLASTDDLLMHSLLALSGAHMASKDPTNQEVYCAMSLHYARLISGLRAEFAQLQDGHHLVQKERLLCLLLVACHYEAVSGNTHGGFFSHLHASRHLAKSLASCKSKDVKAGGGQPWRASDSNSSLLGFSLELYTYTMLCNVGGVNSAPTESLADIFVISMEDMARFPTFGALFAGSHGLYQLIPEIGALAARRLAEESRGFAQPSESLMHAHDELHCRLSQWEMARVPWSVERDWALKCASAEVLRHALYIYLATALAGSVVPKATRCAARCHTGILFKHVQELLSSQHYIATLVWPIAMGASCMINVSVHKVFMREIRDNWSSMSHIDMLMDVMQLLWDDPDPRAFGPYGLTMVMRKNNKTVCIL